MSDETAVRLLLAIGVIAVALYLALLVALIVAVAQDLHYWHVI